MIWVFTLTSQWGTILDQHLSRNLPDYRDLFHAMPALTGVLNMEAYGVECRRIQYVAEQTKDNPRAKPTTSIRLDDKRLLTIIGTRENQIG